MGAAGQFGATVSAFSSLSADPPSVLVCLRSDSRIAKAVLENQTFCVNVLPEEAAEVAERFAGRFDKTHPDRFQHVVSLRGASGDVLEGATSFECTLDKVIPHGSHSICIGGVTAITHRSTKPLSYMDGAFHVVRPAGS